MANNIIPFFMTAWVLSFLSMLPTLLMPLRALLAWLRAPRSGYAFNKLLLKQTQNVPKFFRFLIGLFGVSCIFLSCLLVGITMTAFHADPPKLILTIIIALFVISALVFFLIFILVPATYFFEFYTPPKRRRIFSIAYLFLFLYSLSLPVTVYFASYLFLNLESTANAPFIATMFGVTPLKDEASRRTFDSARWERLAFNAFPVDTAPVRLEHVASTCNAWLDGLGLRMTSQGDTLNTEKLYRMGFVTAEDSDHLLEVAFIDQYLRGITLGAGDFYGCTFSDVTPNTNELGFPTALLALRLCVSLFVIGILILPVRRLLGLEKIPSTIGSD